MKKILCLSTSNYYPFPTRKQNIMNRLTDCSVIYVDPPVTIIAPIKDPKAKDRVNAYKVGGQISKEYPHVKYYAQPPVLPFFNKRRGINEINQKRFAKYLADIVTQNNFDPDHFILWCYSPTSCDVVAPLARALGVDSAGLWARTVYDCVDRHSAYPGLIDPKVVDEQEEDLARSAKYVFATADGLYDRLKEYNSNARMVPNGANYPLFSTVQKLKAGSKEQPIFGFVGALQECTDYDFIRAIASAFPNDKVQLIGRALPGVDLSWIKNYANIELHPPVPQSELPEYIKNFDVCLNCFADNDLSKDVSPLKFYEYLATGKPVLSTPVPLQVRTFEECIYIVETPEELKTQCLAALNEPEDSPRRAMRIEAAKHCSWDERVKEIRTYLDFMEG